MVQEQSQETREHPMTPQEKAIEEKRSRPVAFIENAEELKAERSDDDRGYPSEYQAVPEEIIADERPELRNKFKVPGSRGSVYRGGPYAGLVMEGDVETHNAEASKRPNPTPKEPVSERFGFLKTKSHAARDEAQSESGEDRTMRQKERTTMQDKDSERQDRERKETERKDNERRETERKENERKETERNQSKK